MNCSGLRCVFRNLLQWFKGHQRAGLLVLRAGITGVALWALAAGHPDSFAAESSFGFDHVVHKAKTAASQPLENQGKRLPDFLLKLNYDQWRDIRFQKPKALWQSLELPFTVEFFHPGFLFNVPITIHEVSDGEARPVPFSKQLFNYGKNSFENEIPDDLGFAGFRVHYPLNKNDYFDEFAVFLGASYFRAVSKGQIYGLSARGLAIDTALESGEEFPFFKEFWIVKPESKDQSLTIYALLESKSVCGAYKFELYPGFETVLEVTLALFPRAEIRKLGLAPLTSMYFYSQTTNQRPVDDFRPQIHDSDGLLLAYPTGEFVWRPLQNPSRLLINTFQMDRINGFGLIQRDIVADHYQDLEAYYEKRPSVWVEPVGEWGPGQVELVQIPTDSEKNDNIVAYWTPSEKYSPQKPLSARYRLIWYSSNPTRHHGFGYVVSTRTAVGRDKNHRKFILDFKGGALEKLPARIPADAPLEAVIWTNQQGEVVDRQLYKNPAGGWRLVFEVLRKENSPLEKMLPESVSGSRVEMRVFIKQGDNNLTETWSYSARW